jgi:hypothetical protein
MTNKQWDERLHEILKHMQVQTLQHYDTARKEDSDLATTLLPDAWSLRLDEAKASINNLVAELIGEEWPRPWGENEVYLAYYDPTVKARESLRSELRKVIGQSSKEPKS